MEKPPNTQIFAQKLALTALTGSPLAQTVFAFSEGLKQQKLAQSYSECATISAFLYEIFAKSNKKSLLCTVFLQQEINYKHFKHLKLCQISNQK